MTREIYTKLKTLNKTNPNDTKLKILLDKVSFAHQEGADYEALLKTTAGNKSISKLAQQLARKYGWELVSEKILKLCANKQKKDHVLELLEVIPDQSLVFSWFQEGKSDATTLFAGYVGIAARDNPEIVRPHSYLASKFWAELVVGNAVLRTQDSLLEKLKDDPNMYNLMLERKDSCALNFFKKYPIPLEGKFFQDGQGTLLKNLDELSNKAGWGEVYEDIWRRVEKLSNKEKMSFINPLVAAWMDATPVRKRLANLVPDECLDLHLALVADCQDFELEHYLPKWKPGREFWKVVFEQEISSNDDIIMFLTGLAEEGMIPLEEDIARIKENEYWQDSVPWKEWAQHGLDLIDLNSKGLVKDTTLFDPEILEIVTARRSQVLGMKHPLIHEKQMNCELELS